MKVDYAARAQELVGAPFLPQGRSEDGFDCVGVILHTFGIALHEVPRDYRLRGNHLPRLIKELARFFRPVSPTELRCGDLMLLQAGPRQVHLAVRTQVGFVPAHAGIRRVVETPGLPEWPLLHVYRRRSR